MKKGQGLSLDVIIIAALVLLVLVIVGWVLMARFNIFNTGVSDCLKQSGHMCTTDPSCKTDSNGDPVNGNYIKDTTGLTCKNADDGRTQSCCTQITS